MLNMLALDVEVAAVVAAAIMAALMLAVSNDVPDETLEGAVAMPAIIAEVAVDVVGAVPAVGGDMPISIIAA